MFKRTAAATAALAVAAVGSLGMAGTASGTTSTDRGTTEDRAVRAPLLRMDDAIDSRYIVFLKAVETEAAPREAKEAVEGEGGAIREVYRELGGFAATLTNEQVSDVREDPAVAFVQQDSRMSIDATQTNPTYGLDRIDQRALPLSRAYTYNRTGSAYVPTSSTPA